MRFEGDMRSLQCWLRRQIACGMVTLLALPLTEIAAASPRQQFTNPQQSVSSTQNAANGTAIAAAGPGGNTNRPADAYPENPVPNYLQASSTSGQSSSSQPVLEQTQDNAQKPVGTAAAPSERTTGVAASRPAGAVIAPAKQRRARSFLIRISLVVGAAVAIGTVVALSRASPGRPN